MNRKLLAAFLCAALCLTALSLPVLAADVWVADKPTAINRGPSARPLANGAPVVSVSITPENLADSRDFDVKIEIYGAATGYSADTQIKETLSNYFKDVGSVTLKTRTRVNADAPWAPEVNASGITSSVSGRAITVSGYEFSDLEMLIINFKASPNDLFLGGKGVPLVDDSGTGFFNNNNRTAGFKDENSQAVEQKADVIVPEIVVESVNRNVYYGVNVESNQLLDGDGTENIPKAKAYVKGDTAQTNILDRNDSTATSPNENAEFVKITKKVYWENTESGGTPPQYFTEDVTHTFTVSVDANGDTGSDQRFHKSGDSQISIMVFKPVLQFRDLKAYYGDSVGNTQLNGKKEASSTEFQHAYVEPEQDKQWRHYGMFASATGEYAFDTFLGEKPTIKADGFVFRKSDGTTAITDTDKLAIDGLEDYYIKVASATYTWSGSTTPDRVIPTGLTGRTVDDLVFAHEACTPACGFDPDNGQFMLHVQSCELTVKKAFASNTAPHQGPGETCVVNVKRTTQGGPEVDIPVVIHLDADGAGSVVLNKLPTGSYTATEDGGWSWRYTASSSDSVTLSKDSHSGEITITNTPDKNKWLTDDDYVDNRWGDTGITKSPAVSN